MKKRILSMLMVLVMCTAMLVMSASAEGDNTITQPVRISAVDADGEKLAGAAIQILDYKGDVVEEWVSTSGVYEVGDLTVGEAYRLHATVAPAGYTIPSNITFSVDESGKVSLMDSVNEDGALVIKFDKTEVIISAVDHADDAALEGAIIQILNDHGNVVEEWVSAEEVHHVTGLKTGIAYTLRTFVAPDGYIIPTDTQLSIDEDGEITYTASVTEGGILLVEFEATKVKISAVDADGEKLAGATIQILDLRGDCVEQWSSATDNEATEAIDESVRRVFGLKTGTPYTLRATVAPAGYTVPDDITFSIDENGNISSSGAVGAGGVLLVSFEHIPMIDSISFNSDSETYDSATNSFYIDKEHPLVITVEGKNLKDEPAYLVIENSEEQALGLDVVFSNDETDTLTIDEEQYRQIIYSMELYRWKPDIAKIYVSLKSGDDVNPKKLELNVKKEYDLWVGGEQFTSDKTIINGTTGTAEYLHGYGALVLNNYTYNGEGYDEAAIRYKGNDMLYIELHGENNITTTAKCGLRSNGYVWLDNEGSLTIDSGDIGIYANGGIAIYDGNITVTAGNYGISSGANITVLNGNLNLTATENESCGMWAADTITIENGNVTSIGNFDGMSADNIIINGGDVIATGKYGINALNITITGGTVEAIGIRFGFAAAPAIDEYSSAICYYGESKDEANAEGAKEIDTLAENYSQKYVRIEGVHVHDLEYKYTDSSGHWQECADENCPDENKGKTDIVQHIFDNDEDATCICGYVREASSGGAAPDGDYDYSEPTYTPSVDETENGDIAVSNRYPGQGDKVNITPKPDEGYEVDEVIVTDNKGNPLEVTRNENGTFSFVQPNGKVNIKVTFRNIIENCPGDSACPMYGYNDLDMNAWYHDGVHYCIENGIMNGVGDKIFAPDGTTTRAMIITTLWRLEGSPVVNYLMAFDDVDAEQWYTEAIRWASSEKIIEGYGDGKFGTNDAVTREQLVTIMFRYAKYKGYDISVGEDTNILSYDDAFDVAEWAIPAMQWACGSGMIEGNAMNLMPQGNAERAQTAAILQRFCDNVK